MLAKSGIAGHCVAMKTNEQKQFKPKSDRLISELCFEIDCLQSDLDAMTADRDHFRNEFNWLLSSTLDNAQRTSIGLLALALAPMAPVQAKELALAVMKR